VKERLTSKCNGRSMACDIGRMLAVDKERLKHGGDT